MTVGRNRRITILIGFALAAAALALIAAYASGVIGTGDTAATAIDPTDARQVASGRTLYAEYCAECHGPDLEGEPDWRRRRADGTLPAPPHDASGHTWHHPDELLFRYTKLGGAAVMPEGVVSGMPGFGGTMSDSEILAVLSFIKSRWPEDVRARQRMIDERSR